MSAKHMHRLSRHRDAIYFRAPTRAGSWRVVKVLEHGPYHERRPSTWRGPFATSSGAHRGYDVITESVLRTWLASLDRADVQLPRALGEGVCITVQGGYWTLEPLITGAFKVTPHGAGQAGQAQTGGTP